MIETLRTRNKELIKLYENDMEKYEKQLLIKRILVEDNCFIKMKLETAYSILRDLGVKEVDLKKVYCELIDSSNLK